MPGIPRGRGRHRFQFTIGRILLVVALVALLCALTRLDSADLGRLIYFASMVAVITLGTAAAVARHHALHFRAALIRGGVAGSCLS
jgi:hypothetical protein